MKRILLTILLISSCFALPLFKLSFDGLPVLFNKGEEFGLSNSRGLGVMKSVKPFFIHLLTVSSTAKASHAHFTIDCKLRRHDITLEEGNKIKVCGHSVWLKRAKRVGSEWGAHFVVF